MPKATRYALFGLIYFAEGAILSYFTALNSIYLLSFKLSMSQIGLMGTIALLPFILKIFLGMFSDQVSLFGLGHRKPYIIFGLLVQFVCLLFIPWVNPGTSFGLFALVAFILMLGQALYDTCTDGLALDTSSPEEQGTIQGFMVGGRALGVVVISAVLGVVVHAFGWQAAFWGLALLTLLPLPFALQIREGARSVDREFVWSAFSAFKQPAVIGLGLLGVIYSFTIYGANQIVNPFLNQTFGIGVQSAGLFTTIWGVGVVLGGLTGGRLTDLLGQRRAVLYAMLAALVATLALALITRPSIAWPLVAVFGLAFGYYETVFFALAMRCTDPRIAASMYAILMAMANVGTGLGLGLSGAAVDAIGYRWTFIALGLANLLILPLFGMIFGKDVKQPVSVLVDQP